MKQTSVQAADPVPAGAHQVRMKFAYDGGGLGNETRSEVGRNPGSAVVPDYPAGSRFNGTIHWITIETGDDDHNHLITPEQHLAANLPRTDDYDLRYDTHVRAVLGGNEVSRTAVPKVARRARYAESGTGRAAVWA